MSSFCLCFALFLYFVVVVVLINEWNNEFLTMICYSPPWFSKWIAFLFCSCIFHTAQRWGRELFHFSFFFLIFLFFFFCKIIKQSNPGTESGIFKCFFFFHLTILFSDLSHLQMLWIALRNRFNFILNWKKKFNEWTSLR